MSNIDLAPPPSRNATENYRIASRRRVTAWTGSALRDLGYTTAVFAWSIVGFSVLVSGVAVTASVLPLVIGVVVWVGFVHTLRWTTAVDRRLAGWQRHSPVRAIYRRPATHGFGSRLTTVTRDRQTWRDAGWVALTSIAGFILGLVPVVAAGIALTYVSMPIWYWAIDHAHTEYGLTNLGVLTVDTIGEALAVSAIGFALLPIALVIARGCARTHAGMAARVLDPS